MTQVVVAAELARQGCAELGLAPIGADEPGFGPVDDEETADLGGIGAAVTRVSGHARALVRYFAREPGEGELLGYYQRNPDRFLTEAALRAGIDPFSDTAELIPYDRVRADIARRLRDAAARREFLDWLDARRPTVTLAEGYEHPADPGQPDAEHRH